MTCTRCRGCMIRDQFMDLRDDTGQLNFFAWRCLNCGEVLDGIVLKHRTILQAGPYRSQRRWASCTPSEWPGAVPAGSKNGST